MHAAQPSVWHFSALVDSGASGAGGASGASDAKWC